MNKTGSRSIQSPYPIPPTHSTEPNVIDMLEGELNKHYGDANAELTATKELNAELMERLGELRRRAVTSVDELNRKLSKMTDETWAKDLEVDRLKTALSQAQAETEAQQADAARVIRDNDENHLHEMEGLRETNAALLAQIQRSGGDFAELQNQRNELSDAVNEMQQALQQAFDERAKAFAEQHSRHSDIINSMNLERSAFVEESEAFLAERENVIHQQDAEMQMLRIRLNESEAHSLDLEKSIGELMSKNSEQALWIRQSEEAHGEQARRIEHAEQLLRAFSIEIEAAKAEIDRTREGAAQDLSHLTQSHRIEIEAMRQEEELLQSKFARVQLDRVTLEKKLKEAGDTVVELRETLGRLKSEQDSERRYLELKTSRYVTDLKTQLENDFQQKFEAVALENNQLRDFMTSRDQAIKDEQNRIGEQLADLETREQNSRQVSGLLALAKVDILRLSNDLLAELRRASDSNPLKDYLLFVERELGQLQNQLMQMPPQSPDRPRLENHVGHMMKEYQFLKSVALDAQRSLEERAQKVFSITQSRELK